jgi:hypothetical protein
MQLLQQLLSERESMRNGDAEREHAIRVFEAELTAAVDALGLEVRECVCGEGGEVVWWTAGNLSTLSATKIRSTHCRFVPTLTAHRDSSGRGPWPTRTHRSVCVWPCFMKGNPLAT